MKKGVDAIGVTAVVFCHDGEGNYVFGKRTMQCRDEQGMWENAGGGSVEFGEIIEETIQREVREELCTDVLGHEFLGFRDVHREVGGEKTHWIALDFKVHVDRAQARIGEPDHCEEIQWAPIHSIPKPWHSQLQSCVERYKERL